MWSERQAVEVFHLLFLRAFGARVDQTLYALKGGCNLRFFHKSVRYSEDLDLDVRTIATATLRNHLNRVLESQSFLQTLRAQQIEIASFTAPKQTGTTQRWKIQLRIGTDASAIPTKIEFSRRQFDEGTIYERVEAEIIRRYRLYPVSVQHYSAKAAFEQKINALAARRETQARDIFDIKLLLDAGANGEPLSRPIQQHLPQAIENAMSIGYDAFMGQVQAYLEPEYQQQYRGRRVWEALQQEVVDALGALRS